jgi:5-methylcytosine-specific restriction endonuclease McrA
MAFSPEVKAQALTRAGFRCECNRLACTHMGRCNAVLGLGRWHAHHKHAFVLGGSDTLSNCEALCIPCHERTQSYGRS